MEACLIGAVGGGFVLAHHYGQRRRGLGQRQEVHRAGQLRRQGSDAHKAAVEGDVVGDPFKDTSGPSLNILLKLMAIVSLVFAPLFLELDALIDKI